MSEGRDMSAGASSLGALFLGSLVPGRWRDGEALKLNMAIRSLPACRRTMAASHRLFTALAVVVSVDLSHHLAIRSQARQSTCLPSYRPSVRPGICESIWPVHVCGARVQLSSGRLPSPEIALHETHVSQSHAQNRT